MVGELCYRVAALRRVRTPCFRYTSPLLCQGLAASTKDQHCLKVIGIQYFQDTPWVIKCFKQLCKSRWQIMSGATWQEKLGCFKRRLKSHSAVPAELLSLLIYLLETVPGTIKRGSSKTIKQTIKPNKKTPLHCTFDSKQVYVPAYLLYLNIPADSSVCLGAFLLL